MNTMFEHSVKVPRHYKVAANIFKKAYTEGGSVKTLLYDEKLRHFRTNVLFALVTETIKHAAEIDKIFESCQILAKETRLDPWLAKVLAVELLYGKKTLPGKSKPEQTILSYKEQLQKIKPENQDELNTKVVRRPRYVRVNTNLLATSDAIRAFQDEGYRFIRCTSGSYNDYLQQIQSLTEFDFTQDYHVKTMFVFAPGTKLHEYDLYLENQIILQDKATALAVHLLAPPPGSVVLDMCAAPGMKTTQLAAYLRNQGKIYAVERNEDRFKTLCDFVERTGSKCVETVHKDSLEIKRGDYEDVEYILLDPSCSGSGMDLHVHNYIEDTRLARLTSLQEKFLKHAMNSFPNAKRIIYSTCSLFPEENERVITNIVKASRAKWRVQDVKELLKGQWNNFGSGMYGSMGTRCLYAIPDSDFTIGFFLAVLDRDPKDLEKSRENEIDGEVEKRGNKNRNDSKNTEANIKEMEINNDAETEYKISRKKKKSEHAISTVENDPINIHEKDINKEVKNNGRHKKNSFHKDTNDTLLETDTVSNKLNNFEEVKQKRKKNKKSKEIIDTDHDDVKPIKTEVTHNVTTEINTEIPKKKKKGKRNEKSMIDEDSKEVERLDDNSICNIELESATNIDSVERKKKKKKSKTKEESLTCLTIDDNKNICNDERMNEVNIEEPAKKKKKKIKDKKRDLDENMVSMNTDSHTIEDTNIKSKKNNKVMENHEYELNIEEVSDISNNKRKHKSKHVEESVEQNTNELNDEVPIKKKKHKK